MFYNSLLFQIMSVCY